MFRLPVEDENPGDLVVEMSDAQKMLAAEVEALELEDRRKQEELNKIDQYFENLWWCIIIFIYYIIISRYFSNN